MKKNTNINLIKKKFSQIKTKTSYKYSFSYLAKKMPTHNGEKNKQEQQY